MGESREPLGVEGEESSVSAGNPSQSSEPKKRLTIRRDTIEALRVRSGLKAGIGEGNGQPPQPGFGLPNFNRFSR